jgi:molybdopterin adenylyltransferase
MIYLAAPLAGRGFMSHTEHEQSAKDRRARCGVVTLSDTRTPATDKSGMRVKDLLAQSNHSISHYEVIPDDSAQLDSLLTDLLARNDINLIITTGGTGISPRDNTIAVIEKHLTIPLPGFGELFRSLSYAEIGPAAMLSRATAGVANGKLLFALPGSTKAVELAMTKLILPQLAHMLMLIA